MEAVPEGVKLGPCEAGHRSLRVITECRELSSLSSTSDGFRAARLRNCCPRSVLRRGTPLALMLPDVHLTNQPQDTRRGAP